MSNWTAWLRQNAEAGRGGVTLAKSIVRDLPYELVLAISSDVSADAFSASLRLSPDADGATLADFTVVVGSYASGATNVTLSLTKTQVNALPADADADGLEELLFDVLHTPSGGTQYRMLAGAIPVSGKVTAGA